MWINFDIPRLACSLAAQGDAPAFLGKLHSRFSTPSAAIVLYAGFIWLLAVTGAYLWISSLGAGALLLVYIGTCAALIRLRARKPQTNALRMPLGRGLAIFAIITCLAAFTRLHARQALLIGITALIAAANSWWAKRRDLRNQQAAQAVFSV